MGKVFTERLRKRRGVDAVKDSPGKKRGPKAPRAAASRSREPMGLGNRFAAEVTGSELQDLEASLASTPAVFDRPWRHQRELPATGEGSDSDPTQREMVRQVDEEVHTKAKLSWAGPPAYLAEHPHTACKVIDILLVEDNTAHVRLMQEALKDSSAEFTMTVVPDGVEAMAYLFRLGEHAGARRPDLILLDLNLPRKDGREVLEEIKNEKDLASIPVVVLTSSMDESDIRMSYGLQANCFISKPTNLSEFANVVKMIESFWGSFVRLP